MVNSYNNHRLFCSKCNREIKQIAKTNSVYNEWVCLKHGKLNRAYHKVSMEMGFIPHLIFLICVIVFLFIM